MVCGGLKFVESKIDQRLLGNHFSVRCMDYAFEMANVANSIKLKTGQKLRVKIGLHTGEVIAGVVGETKPQFSLIGDTVNKTSRVCSKCPAKEVLISKETYKMLEIYSNNFTFDSMEVFMKGIGTEKVYKVYKKGLRNRNTQQPNTSPMLKLANAAQTKFKIPNFNPSGNFFFNQDENKAQPPQSPKKSRTMKIVGRKNHETLEDQNQNGYDQVARTDRSQESHDDRMSDQQNQSQEGDEVRKQFGKEDR